MSIETKVTIKPNTRIAEPKLYDVVFMNDEITHIDFVVGSLIKHFRYDESTADRKANEISEEGYGKVATCPFEIAEQKQAEITQEARSNHYPLTINLVEAN